VSPKAGLDVLEKRKKFLPPTGIGTPDRPLRVAWRWRQHIPT